MAALWLVQAQRTGVGDATDDLSLDMARDTQFSVKIGPLLTRAHITLDAVAVDRKQP